MLKVVATSTVVAALPTEPPVGLSDIVRADSKVLEALVNVLPVVTVKPLLKVPKPVTPNVPPRVVAPVPTTVNVLPLAIVVSPFRLTAPVPVPKVPDPLWLKLPLVWL